MYLFHSTLHLKPESAKDFELLSDSDEKDIRAAPGFIRRMLLKDNENPGRYFYISMWNSSEDADAYRGADATKARVKNAIEADRMAEPVARVQCDLISYVD